MGLVNPLIGGGMSDSVTVTNPDALDPEPPAVIATAGADGTEWVVAIIVLTALGFLVLFRLAGFQAVIAASAKVGG